MHLLRLFPFWLKRILRGEPTSSGDTYVDRALAALDRDDYSVAIRQLEVALKLGLAGYDRSYVYTLLGKAYEHSDQSERAIAAHRQALKLDPRNFRAWNNLGVAYCDLGRLDEAEECHQKALDLAPDYAYAYASLGAVYIFKNDAVQALQVLDRAIALNPRLATAHSNRALACAMLSEFDQAYAALKQAIVLGYQGWQAVKLRIDGLKSLEQALEEDELGDLDWDISDFEDDDWDDNLGDNGSDDGPDSHNSKWN